MLYMYYVSMLFLYIYGRHIPYSHEDPWFTINPSERFLVFILYIFIHIHTYLYLYFNTYYICIYIHIWIHIMVVGVKYVLFSTIFFGVETSSLIMFPWSPWTLQVISCWVGAWVSLGRRSIRSCRNPSVLWTAVGRFDVRLDGLRSWN